MDLFIGGEDGFSHFLILITVVVMFAGEHKVLFQRSLEAIAPSHNF
jgi:hypothetical protein